MFEVLALTELAMLVGIGLVTGFLAGLLGIGGGMVLVPCLVFILGRHGMAGDAAIKTAIATAMATILFTSLSSVRAHHRRGAIRWGIVTRLAPGIVIGGLVAGAGAFSVLKGQALGLFFAVFVGYSAWRMFKGSTASPADGRALHGPVGIGLVGGGIGFVSGLVGAGGGFLSVPYMTRCNVPMHNAVATSAALGFPIALANVAGYIVSGHGMAAAIPGMWGYLYLPALVCIVVCSVATAPLGARAAHAMDIRALKRAFSLVLALLSGYMFFKLLD